MKLNSFYLWFRGEKHGFKGGTVKKISLFLFTAAFLVLPVRAEKDLAFKSLQFSAVTNINVDTFLTYEGIWNRGFGEANPFWQQIIDKPALVLSLDMAINTAILWGTTEIYKKDKLLAYAVVIGINLVQGYYLYKHFRARGWIGH